MPDLNHLVLDKTDKQNSKTLFIWRKRNLLLLLFYRCSPTNPLPPLTQLYNLSRKSLALLETVQNWLVSNFTTYLIIRLRTTLTIAIKYPAKSTHFGVPMDCKSSQKLTGVSFWGLLVVPSLFFISYTITKHQTNSPTSVISRKLRVVKIIIQDFVSHRIARSPF